MNAIDRVVAVRLIKVGEPFFSAEKGILWTTVVDGNGKRMDLQVSSPNEEGCPTNSGPYDYQLQCAKKCAQFHGVPLTLVNTEIMIRDGLGFIPRQEMLKAIKT